MVMKSRDKWFEKYEALRKHVLEHGHFCEKHSQLNNWAKYQRKRIKAGTMPEEQLKLFMELCAMRSNEHTGGRRKKMQGEESEVRDLINAD